MCSVLFRLMRKFSAWYLLGLAGVIETAAVATRAALRSKLRNVFYRK